MCRGWREARRAAEFGLRSLLGNKSAVAIPIFQAQGSNAIEISNQVRASEVSLDKNFRTTAAPA